jgi:hypothetical protein
MALSELNLANVSEHRETWERVVRKLRAGMMPPSGMPRPEPDALEAFVVALENELDQTLEAHLPPPGLHRMNRTEYSNVIFDLLGVRVDPSQYMPPDDSTRGFDNIAGALTLSPALLEGYVSAAGKVSRLAIGSTKTDSESVFLVPSDTSQDYHVEGLPFGTRGGLLMEHEFPADGEYEFKIWPVNLGNMNNNRAFGDVRGEKLKILVDGEQIKEFDWDSEIGRGAAVINGTEPVRVKIPAGRHAVGVTFLARQYAPGNDLNRHFLRSTLETGGLPGYTFYPHVGKMAIRGPFSPAGASETESRRRIFVCEPANAGEETACAREIVSTVARRAYRRPATSEDLEILMSFYQQGRNEGSFDSGIEMALRRILADPQFLFRKEAEPAGLAEGEAYRISDLELASRLSFFLWSSIPDDELIELASESRLRDPAVLERQVRRMLADARSERLVENIAGQWLGLRSLDSFVPVASLYPDFDDNLRQALRRETEMFFASIVREDRPVTELLDADYTFLNERLAKHYGIPNIYGSNFRRVQLGDDFSQRRGLLGKGSFLTVSSYPNRNSPVVRGVTVMRMFLGVEPPPPPPNVPDLPPQANNLRGGAKPTMRQQMEAHQVRADCVQCHRIMDPIGFSLENFDAIGRWRTQEDGSAIDPSGQLVDGSELNGVEGLRQALISYTPQFTRLATEKMMIYALGRGTEYYDMPLIRRIVREAEGNDYRFSSIVLGIARSDPFQKSMKLQTSGNSREGREIAARQEAR